MVISLLGSQKCYFGYGASRPRSGERSQYVAFQKYLLEQIGHTMLENCEESKQLTTRALIEIAKMARWSMVALCTRRARACFGNTTWR